TLIFHGDADTLVPLDQSQRYQRAARALGGKVELVVHRGGRHGWWSMIWDIHRFAGWFDHYLRAAAPERNQAGEDLRKPSHPMTKELVLK
ncbi:MAG TPA: hypothetical protein VHI52_21365, partial [Verrucomicrobiae bacterium]|nr:hypothetical protein [Verrucomicrobiae bacterium]